MPHQGYRLLAAIEHGEADELNSIPGGWRSDTYGSRIAGDSPCTKPEANPAGSKILQIATIALLIANIAILAFAVSRFETIRSQLADLLDVVDTRALPLPDTLHGVPNGTRRARLL